MKMIWGTKRRMFLQATIVALAAMATVTTFAAAGELRIGTSLVKINSPDGTPMDGGYGENLSKGVLDDLHAKAIVLDDGTTKVAMITCDTCGLAQGVVDAARALVVQKAGIPAVNVMISATHTHTGPKVVGDSSTDFLIAGDNKLSTDYAQQLPQWIAQAVGEANGRLVPAKVSFGHEFEPNISYIRRYWMKDGTVGWNPGWLNPNIIRPIGQIDPEVNVFFAESAEKKPLLTYVNFPLHTCTTGGSMLSADYPCQLAKCLADYLGPDMLTVFANGTCGNVNHYNVRWGDQPLRRDANRIGTVIAAAVCKAYMNLTSVNDRTLRVRREVVPLTPDRYDEKDLPWAREIVAKRGAGTPFMDQVKACKIVDIADRYHNKPINTEVQVFALGQDVAWVALPGEVFVELGMSIKAGSPFRQTNVIELSNGPMFYIPNCSAYPEGEYEVATTRYAVGSGERLVTTALRLLGELHQEAAGAK